jgi:hypothetical protein
MARDDGGDRDDGEPGWGRQLLVVVGVLLAVALVIGGVVSVIALGAARVTGLDSARARATQKPSLFIPSGTPTTGLDDYPGPSAGSSPSSSPGDGSSSATARPKKKKPAITLQAFPQQVAASQRINLTGVYQGGEGARLQVERFEAGRWTDFPVGASVSGGQFTTYVTTSRSGVQRFRVVDPLSDTTSNPVRVTVG